MATISSFPTAMATPTASSAAWQPQESGLQEILGLLRDSTSHTQNQLATQRRLEQFAELPECQNYYMFIFSQLTSEPEGVRALAGLQLKNNLRKKFELYPPHVIHYIKQCALATINVIQMTRLLQNTLGSIISALVHVYGILEWPVLIPALIHAMESQSLVVAESATSIMHKMCEDFTFDLDSPDVGQPSRMLIPKFLALTQSPSDDVRLLALKSMNSFVILRSNIVFSHIDNLINILIRLSADTSEDVRSVVCQSFSNILDASVNALMARLHDIAPVQLKMISDSDENVQMEATEFWLALASSPVASSALMNYVPTLIPLLLRGMVYSEEHLASLNEEDAERPDRDQDIKPQFHRGKDSRTGTTAVATENSEVENDEDEDEDEDDEEDASEWNLRKCSAATFDTISNIYKDQMLPTVLPLIRSLLGHSDWLHQECGILSLGAIAEGMVPHLADIVPFLINYLSHEKPLIRSISCWTISRYAAWICEQPLKSYYEPALSRILHLMSSDKSKSVQEAACSAVAVLEESCPNIMPYLNSILQHCIISLPKYQKNNLIILYDVIQSLCVVVGPNIATEGRLEPLMMQLMTRWQNTPDDSPDMFGLLECLQEVAECAGDKFLPFATPLYERSVNLIESIITSYLEEDPDALHSDYIVASLAFLGHLAQGLKGHLEPIVVKHGNRLVSAIISCLKEDTVTVLQSAFGLIGDLAVCCFSLLTPYLPQLLPMAINRFDPSLETVCNNAIWCVGEIAFKAGPSIQPYVQPIMEKCSIVMKDFDSIKPTLQENVAITIGRLGLWCPRDVGLYLPGLISRWCRSLTRVMDNAEKESAYLGLCTMIHEIMKENPTAVFPQQDDFLLFCEALGGWTSPSPTLVNHFRQILQSYQQLLGSENWNRYMSALDSPVREKLQVYCA